MGIRFIRLSAPGPRPSYLTPRLRASCSANLRMISVSLKEAVWYQRCIQNFVKHLKAANYFYKTLHLRCLTGSLIRLWIWFPFWKKKVYSIEFSNQNLENRTLLGMNKRHLAGSAMHEAVFFIREDLKCSQNSWQWRVNEIIFIDHLTLHKSFIFSKVLDVFWRSFFTEQIDSI